MLINDVSFFYFNSRAAMSTSPNLQSDIPSQSQPDAPANLKLPSSRFIFWLVLCAMVLLASNMRAPIVALGSIAPVVQGALDISETQIGWLGAVPMLTFALGAFISPTIGKRFGLENTLITMIALLTAGMVIRSVIPTWIGFLSGTLLLTLAIGFANTLAAPVIKQRTPNHIPLITGFFSLTMTVSAGIVAGVVLPLSEQFGWQWALGGWSILGLFALIIWVVLRLRLGSSNHQP
ncbi:MAG: MFS transporter, partial [Psychrobacter sp.]|nr:MFS transporter [Psychrobacter sp.]